MLRLCSFMFKNYRFTWLKLMHIWISISIWFLRRRPVRHLWKNTIESYFWCVWIVKCKTRISNEVPFHVQNICLSSLMRPIFSWLGIFQNQISNFSLLTWRWSRRWDSSFWFKNLYSSLRYFHCSMLIYSTFWSNFHI